MLARHDAFGVCVCARTDTYVSRRADTFFFIKNFDECIQYLHCYNHTFSSNVNQLHLF